MRTIVKHLQYSVKGSINFCEYCATAKIKQKSLHKVAQERDLKLGKMIYLDIISQNKLIKEVPRIRSSYKTKTQNKMVFLHESKRRFT